MNTLKERTSIRKQWNLKMARWGVAIAAVIVLSSNAAADDKRQGIVIGGGVGPGVASLSFPDADRQNYIGVATDITLGYGLSSQLLVYAMSRIVWFDLDGQLTFSETAGLGVSYFLSDSAPSLFVAAGVGAAVFVQPGSDTDNQIGIGGLVGIGYEFKRHWLVEVDVAYNKPDDFSSTTIMTKLNFYYY